MRSEVSGNGQDGCVAAGLRMAVKRKLQVLHLLILLSTVGKGPHVLWAVAAMYFQADPSSQEGFAGFPLWPEGPDRGEAGKDPAGTPIESEIALTSPTASVFGILLRSDILADADPHHAPAMLPHPLGTADNKRRACLRVCQ